MRSSFPFMLLGLLHFLMLSMQVFGQENLPRIGDVIHDGTLSREDDVEFKEARERWLREMRWRDPAINPDVVDAVTREAKLLALAAEKIEAVPFGGDVKRWAHVAGGLWGFWTERGSANQAGRTRNADIDFERGLIYVAGDGGQIWRGTLAGGDWTPLNDRQRFPGVRMLRLIDRDDASGKRIVVLHGSSFRYSDDDGETWVSAEGLDEIARWGEFSRGAVDASGAIWAIGTEWDYSSAWRAVGTLYRSTDGGESFSRVRLFENSFRYDLDLSAAPGGPLYVVLNDTLWQATNDGQLEPLRADITFPGQQGEQVPLQSVMHLYLRVFDAARLYIIAGISGEAAGNVLFYSSDSGRTWERRGPTTNPFDRNSFALSGTDPALVVVGGVETMVTRDGGFAWDTVNKWPDYYSRPDTFLHADIPFVGFYPTPEGGEMALISTDGGIYSSNDNLQSVRNLSLWGLRVGQYYSVYTSSADTNYIFLGSQDQGFQRSASDSGGLLGFRQIISGDYGHVSSGDGGRSVWMNYPGFAMYYPDAWAERIYWGSTWDFNTHGMAGHLWLPPIVAHPGRPEVAYLAGGRLDTSGTHIIRLEIDTARQVQATQLPYDFGTDLPGATLVAIGISPVDTNLRYAFTNLRRLHSSTDGGETWNPSETFFGPSNHYFYGSTILPSLSTPGTVYVAGNGYSDPGVWVSQDNGLTFDTMTAGLPQTFVYDLAATPDDRYLFAATEVGPYVFIADSGRWYDAMGEVTPDLTYWSVEYIAESGTARFATYGRGVWDLRLVESPVSSVGTGAGATAELALHLDSHGPAGYHLACTMPAEGMASIRIYDLTGRIVATLHEGSLAAGEHRFIWDGRADGGGHVPSGFYLGVVGAAGRSAHAKIPVAR